MLDTYFLESKEIINLVNTCIMLKVSKRSKQTELANSELTDGVNTHATPDGVATLNAVTKSDHGLKYPAHSVQVFLSTP